MAWAATRAYREATTSRKDAVRPRTTRGASKLMATTPPLAPTARNSESVRRRGRYLRRWGDGDQRERTGLWPAATMVVVATKRWLMLSTIASTTRQSQR